MAYWLFKQEPSTYNYAHLEKDGETAWDGVANNLALKHLRSTKKGDQVFFYHSGEERQIVGIMQIISEPYSDAKASGGKGIVLDVKPVKRLSKPVTLQEIKKDQMFSGWELVRISRLSVMPVTPKMWDRIILMSKAQL